MSERYHDTSEIYSERPAAPPVASRAKQRDCLFFLLGLGLFWAAVVAFLIYKCT